MHRFLLACGLCLALGACATAPSQALPRCDGQHRRPANPNGSALLAPAPAAVLTKPAPARPPAASAASFAPCGNLS